jgi:arabinose-5-phosphate isomerase
MSDSTELGRRVLRIEAEAVAALAQRLDERFDRAVELLLCCKGRVVLTGMGKSGLVARKIAATLSSTGTPSLFLHPAEALHGDLGMLVRGDTVVAVSYGGETEELIRLLDWIKRLGLSLITLTGEPQSALATASDVVLDIAIAQEACPLGLAPTASTTAAMALGDALALAVLERRGFDQQDFARLHPAGDLGRRLRLVEHVMHVGEAVPVVRVSTPMPDVIYEMSRKGFGVTAVLDDAGALAGIISDGDLRRLLQRRKGEVMEVTAGECMTCHPVTIARTALATAALQLLEARKITSLLAVDADGRLEGIVHLHDLWTTQMI